MVGPSLDSMKSGRSPAARPKKSGRLGARRVGLHSPAPFVAGRRTTCRRQKLWLSPAAYWVTSSPMLGVCEPLANCAEKSFFSHWAMKKKYVRFEK